jgi:CRISPR/Cas system CMR-associated protein Cmr3 (group 5 of RAMP superfamily)
MEVTSLDIVPMDIVTVRDGRPFDAGGAHLARAVWPPSPWTALGAIRTLLLHRLGVNLEAYAKSAKPETNRDSISKSIPPEALEILGPADGPPGFEIGPVLLHRRDAASFSADVWLEGTQPTGGGPLFPPPLDLAFAERETNGNPQPQKELVRLVLRALDSFSEVGYRCSALTPSVLLPPDERRLAKPPGEWKLTLNGLKKYLAGKNLAWLDSSASSASSVRARMDRTGAMKREKSVESEARVGIAMNKSTGTADEGMLYTRRGYALGPAWSLFVPLGSDCHHGVKDLCGTIRLGGDGHLARVNPKPTEIPDAPAFTNEKHQTAVLYFASPARAEDLTTEALSRIAGGSVSVLAAASSRPLSIGGWRMAAHKPRTMRKYQPAGTVVYVRTEDDDCDLAKFHGRSLAADAEEAAAGFAWCLVGRV